MKKQDNHPQKKRNNHDDPLIDSSNKPLSHTLSWALRHAAPSLHLPMTSDGYVPVHVLLHCPHPRFQGPNGPKYTVAQVQHVVTSCPKQRYSLTSLPLTAWPLGSLPPDAAADASEPILAIRANQGHSISNGTLDASQLLTRLTPDDIRAYPVLVHGTFLRHWPSIREQGLKRMNRQHIHIATGLPGSTGVQSGMRSSCQVHIYLDPEQCAKESDMEWYCSANGVILTAGVNGTIPVRCFSHVLTSTGHQLYPE
jgi:2'-phosphotransferase